MKPEDINETIKEITGIKIITERDKLIEGIRKAVNKFKGDGFKDEEIRVIFSDAYKIVGIPFTLILMWVDEILKGK